MGKNTLPVISQRSETSTSQEVERHNAIKCDGNPAKIKLKEKALL